MCLLWWVYGPRERGSECAFLKHGDYTDKQGVCQERNGNHFSVIDLINMKN